MRIIGVTGTNGKTSCVYFLTQALTLLHKNAVMMGTIGVGHLGNLLESSHTTLPAVKLLPLLDDFLDDGVEFVSMEISSHALVQKRAADVLIEVAIFTNLTQDHLDYHHTMQAYGEAKALLFQFASLKYAVINLDDPFADTLIATIRASLPIIGVSVTGKTHARCVHMICARQIQFSAQDTRAIVSIDQNDYPLATHLLGQFNILNLLCVLGALLALGFAPDSAVSVLSQLQEPPGRLTRIGDVGKTPSVFIDYAHTPDALEKVLAVLKALCPGKLWCVFGCGGDRDTGKRPLMAKIAEQYADHIIVTDDNPRTEASEKIIQEIVVGFARPEVVSTESNRKLAIEGAISAAGVNDFVLIAGKGHEDYQIIGTEKIPFSDKEIAQTILQSY